MLQEKYILTAFELLHEFLEDGQLLAATKLQDFFSNEEKFPPDQMLQLQSLQALETQQLSDDKESALAKVAASEYELRLAHEDIQRLQERLEEQSLATSATSAVFMSEESSPHMEHSEDGEDLNDFEEKNSQGSRRQMSMRSSSIGDLERRDLNCAVKEYLMAAGYKLTAMCLHDEVGDQDLDKWEPSAAHVEKALRTYYQHFLNTKIDNEHLQQLEEDNRELLKQTEDVRIQIDAVTTERDALLSALADSKQALGKTVLELQDQCDSTGKSPNSVQLEVETLKEEIQVQKQLAQDALARLQISENEKAAAFSKVADLQVVLQSNSGRGELNLRDTEAKNDIDVVPTPTITEGVSEVVVDKRAYPSSIEADELQKCHSEASSTQNGNLETGKLLRNEEGDNHLNGVADVEQRSAQSLEISDERSNASEMGKVQEEDSANGIPGHDQNIPAEEGSGTAESHSQTREDAIDRVDSDQIRRQSMEVDGAAVLIIAESLPKIVPNVLIQHREELLPLFICVIERHPDINTRDDLTNGLFNLIKKPNEEQRRIIMDACVTLAAKIGVDKTESELLPQCWEQINHKFHERRLLVAQSCGELAEFVRPSIRSSLIFSILCQLTEDSSPVVREEVARNLALLLPYIDDLEKYPKVEETVFRLVCDPAGEVVKESLQTLVPALLDWAKAKRHPLSHFLRGLLNRVTANVQQAPPASGVEGSPEANLRILGERQRWNVDVLLRMLTERLRDIRHAAIKTCPAILIEGNEGDQSPESSEENGEMFFSQELLQRYASCGGEEVRWPALDWLAADCLPTLLRVACMLPPREEALRLRLARLLLAISHIFGRHYSIHTLLPIVLAAAGYPLDSKGIPPHVGHKIEELQPIGVAGERLARMCVLPLLFTGVLGAPGMRESMLGEYLRELVLSTCLRSGPWNDRESPDLIDAVRFLCTQAEHHDVILGVLWELVVNPTPSIRITAAVLFKALAGYVDEKRMSQQALPALVTLGSDPNVEVKHSSIAALGAVALHFKDETIVEKVRIQMDSYLEDGSQEAALAVIRALTAAVPVTTSRLRDYLLQKLSFFCSLPLGGNIHSSRKQEWLEAICGAIRALDSTELSTSGVQTYLLPVIQALLKEPDLLQPPSKEALEAILRERGGIRFDALGKAMGKSLFGDGGLFVKREAGGESGGDPKSGPTTPVAEGGFARIMRSKYDEMLRSRATNKQFSNG